MSAKLLLSTVFVAVLFGGECMAATSAGSTVAVIQKTDDIEVEICLPPPVGEKEGDDFMAGCAEEGGLSYSKKDGSLCCSFSVSAQLFVE